MNGKHVRIVPCQEKNAEGVLLSQGTEVYCGDQKLTGITEISVHFCVDDLVRADLTLIGHVGEIEAAIPSYYVADPETGKIEQVKTVVFANGKRLDFVC